MCPNDSERSENPERPDNQNNSNEPESNNKKNKPYYGKDTSSGFSIRRYIDEFVYSMLLR